LFIDREPDEIQNHLAFIVRVDEEWRDVNGFQVFEIGGVCEVVDEVMMGMMREWYCAKAVEPPGGFVKGQYGFCPASKNFTHKKWRAKAVRQVTPIFKKMCKRLPDGSLKTMKYYIQFEDEQHEVTQCYNQMRSGRMSIGQGEGGVEEDVNEDSATEEGTEEGGDDDDEGDGSPPPGKSAKNVSSKSPAAAKGKGKVVAPKKKK